MNARHWGDVKTEQWSFIWGENRKLPLSLALRHCPCINEREPGPENLNEMLDVECSIARVITEM